MKKQILINGKTPSEEELEILAEHKRKVQRRQLENNLAESSTRARSITVGTALGGTSELMMRRLDGTVTWIMLQPVEVIELIHQLAANVGCHINLQPRRDFSSWREWKHTPEELAHYRGEQHQPGVGFAPHTKAMIDGGYSTQLPAPEQQPGLQTALMARSNSNENETVAAEKPVKRTRTKRSTTPT